MTQLPTGWALATMADACLLVQSGGTPKGGFTAAGVPFLKVYNIVDQQIDFDYRPQFVPQATHDTELAKSRVRPGDVLMNIVGPPLGKVAIVPEQYPAWNINQALTAFRPSEAAPTKWLYYFLCGGAPVRSVINATRGSAGQVNISLSQCRAFEIVLPPAPEQRRIVAKIDSLTGKSRRARDHLDHIPRLVEKYKQAVLTAAFKGDLTREWRRENSVGWSSKELTELKARREIYLSSRRGSRLHRDGEREEVVPRGWFAAQLSDLGRLQVGYAYKSKWYTLEGVRLLRGANIAPGRLSWEDEARLPSSLAGDYDEYRVNEGDIVIAMDRPIISTGLKAARITSADAGCLLVQRVARYAPSELVDADYVWHLINSLHFIGHAVTQATGSDLPHISSNDILTTPVPLPCLPEQKEVSRRIGMAMSWIDRVATEATSARKLIDRLDQAVLAKAFRGELVPQDPADEPASALLERIKTERNDASKQKRRGKG